MLDHICEVCGGSFISGWTSAKYCSGKCRQKAYRMRSATVTAKSKPGNVCIRCGKGTMKGNRYCSLSCKTLTNREKHSATYRTIKAITGKTDYEVWTYCEADWKTAYAMLEARNYRYSASLKVWQYIPHTQMLPLEFNS